MEAGGHLTRLCSVVAARVPLFADKRRLNGSPVVVGIVFIERKMTSSVTRVQVGCVAECCA